MLRFHSRIIDYLFPKSNNSTMFFPAVYGIRAVAIIFIVLSAFNIPFIHGGNMGYSILFVVSGYLFTDSLLEDIKRDNKINLLKFYKHRALKIFPPLISMILIFSILIAILRREVMPNFKSDILPSILQFENWWRIIRYDAASTAVYPLAHLWAISAMVQLIIIWSLILWGIIRFFKDERVPIIVAMSFALISFLLLIYFYSPDSATRGLFGTDTRSFSFFMGAALACYTGNPRDRIWKYPVFIMDILGGISLVGLILILIIAKDGRGIYTLTNLLISLFTACILLSAFRPSSLLARILGFSPFSAIGRSSYGVYLWHIPFIILLRAEEGIKWWSFIIGLILTGIAAWASYRFIETPVRKGVIADAYRIIDGTPKSTYEKQEYRRTLKNVRIFFLTLIALIILSLACVFMTSGDSAEIKKEEPKSGAEEGSTEDEGALDLPSGFSDTNTLFIGDELALNAHDMLIDNIPNITVDVAGSRYSTSAGPIYEAYANGGWDGRIIIISLSNSGEMFDSLEDIRERMSDNQLLFIINNRGSEWEQSNNSKITDFVNVTENTYAVDWYGASENHPEYFDEAGGLSADGTEVYTEVIKRTVEAVLNR